MRPPAGCSARLPHLRYPGGHVAGRPGACGGTEQAVRQALRTASDEHGAEPSGDHEGANGAEALVGVGEPAGGTGVPEGEPAGLAIRERGERGWGEIGEVCRGALTL